MRCSLNKTLLFIALLVPWLGFANNGYETGDSYDDIPMYCHSGIQVSVNELGFGVILPQMLLAQPFPNYDRFIVTIMNPPMGIDTVTCDMVGQTIDVMVTDTISGNACWSEVTVEDKLDPSISCSDVILPCNVDPFNLPDSVGPTMLSDNCTDSVDLIVTFSQSSMTLDCQVSPFVLKLTRIYTVTDESGNSSSCMQMIFFEKGDVTEVMFPADTTIQCPAASTDVSVTGEPTINGMPIDQLCMIVTTNQDMILEKCGNSFVIQRKFIATDWCTGDTEMATQTITVIDTTAPVITCPGFEVVPAGMDCQADYTIDGFVATDACADDTDITYQFFVDGVFQGSNPNVMNLDTGLHTIRIVATDPCFNSSDCEYDIEVIDQLPPMCLSITDITVTLDTNGLITLPYDFFDNVEFMDNCGLADTMIRRVFTSCPGNMADRTFGDSVTFCCDDVGMRIMVGLKVTDISGLMRECIFGAFVVDNNNGVGLVCPADVTVSCDTFDENSFPMPTTTAGCPVVVEEFTTLVQDSCGRGTFTRMFIATRTSGMVDSCTQIVTIVNPFDFTPDSLIIPPDITLTECAPDTSFAGTGEPTILDNFCMNIELSYRDSIPDPDSACLIIYRIFEIFNACDTASMITGTQTILVKNNGAPEILPPAGGVFFVDENCEVDIDLPPVILDDCSTDVTVTNDFNGQGGDIDATFMPGTYTITFTATNLCGESSTAETVLVVVDNTAPEVDCPVDITLNCFGDTDPSNTGTATGTDNCTNPPAITFFDSSAPGMCANTFTITRSWIATDASSNADTCTQTITVQDTTPPVIVCPDDIVLNCPDMADPGNTGFPTATDDCNNPPTIAIMSDITVTGSCPNTFTIERTWIATDACMNTATCMQLIVVQDTTPPMIACPDDVVLNCPTMVTPANTGTATAIDDCNNPPTITMDDVTTQGPCANTFTIVRTWTATDDCMNSASCIQIITVQDTTAPVITCPDDVVVNCPGMVDPSTTGMATATDECNDPPTITSNDVTITGSCPNTFTIERTWTATDDCMNTASCLQLIVVQDTTAPVIVCPADITLDCPSMTNPANTGRPTATDECNNPPVITRSDNVLPGACAGTRTIERTWIATDACGNVATCLQLIVVQDTTPPDVTCPADITLNCPADTDPSNTGTATGTDECNNPPAITFFDVTTPGSCPNTPSIQRFWIATDACLNADTCIQLITVQDTTAPVIACPADITIECPMTADTSITGVATAVDECNNVTISFSDATMPGSCPNTFSIVRTWTATDPCGNSSSCEQNIEIVDTTPPTIVCPMDITVSCNGDTTTANTGLPTVMDACNNPAIVVYMDSVVTGTGSVIFTIFRTFKATDACGNMASCTQVIEVVANVDPVIECPNDTTLFLNPDSCQLFVGIPPPNVMEGCGDVTVTNDGNGDGMLDASGIYPGGTTTVTYIVVDGAGNSDTCMFTITLLDTIPPMIVCPPDTNVDCNEALTPLSQFGSPTATDNCPGVTVEEVDSFAIDQCGVGTITRTFTATDAVGNTAACTQVINVTGMSMIDSTDFIYPDPFIEVFDCVDFEDIMLTPPMLDPNINTCNVITVDSTVEMIVPATFGCMTFEVTYIITDSCNFDPLIGDGQFTFLQTIGITDTIPPVINPIAPGGPYFADTNCMAEVILPDVTATDDCNTFSIMNNSPFANSNGANASGTYPGGLTVVTFTATDKCGNMDTFNLNIFITDTIDPVLICLKTEYDLGDDLSIDLFVDTVITSADDNCANISDITITYDLNDLTDTLLTFDCDDINQILFRMVYLIDAQGNVDSCESEFGITDNAMLCPPTRPVMIGGIVHTPNQDPISNTQIMMQANGEMDMSDTDGNFMFEEVPPHLFHRMDAEKSDPYLNGVTAYDLSVLMQHVAGIEYLNDPYLYYAADANGDEKIDIRDVLELRKLLLGINDELPITSWRFYDAHYDLTNATDPFHHKVPEYVKVYNNREDMMDADFIGVKSGDLDYTADLGLAGGDTRSGSKATLQFGQPDEQGRTPIYLKGDLRFTGGQVEILFDQAHQIVEVVGNENMYFDPLNEVNSALFDENTLRIVWVAEGEIISSNEPLGWIVFAGDSDLELKPTVNELFYNEFFDRNGEKLDVEVEVLSEDHVVNADEGFVLYQNVPNPFRNVTTISFNLPDENSYELAVYDAKGAMIHSSKGEGKRGLNRVEINDTQLNGTSGVLYYRLSTDLNHAVRKMIVNE